MDDPLYSLKKENFKLWIMEGKRKWFQKNKSRWTASYQLGTDGGWHPRESRSDQIRSIGRSRSRIKPTAKTIQRLAQLMKAHQLDQQWTKKIAANWGRIRRRKKRAACLHEPRAEGRSRAAGQRRDGSLPVGAWRRSSSSGSPGSLRRSEGRRVHRRSRPPPLCPRDWPLWPRHGFRPSA